MVRHLVIGLIFLAAAACVSPAQTGDGAIKPLNFDTCLLTNMAAVVMLEDEIAKTEDVLTRARMTEDAYKAVQAELSEKRNAIARLLESRGDMLRDETLDESEQAASNSTLISRYSGGADALLAEAKTNGDAGTDLAAKATSCGERLSQ